MNRHMAGRAGGILGILVLAIGCDGPAPAAEPSDETACTESEEAALAEAVGRAIVEPAAPNKTVTVDGALASEVAATYRLRWAMHEIGHRSDASKKACFLDAWADRGALSRLVVACEGQIVYDSEQTLGYGAPVSMAALTELPQRRPELPDYGHYYYSEADRGERKYQYQLHVDRIEQGDTALALDTKEGWLSLRRAGFLDNAETKWTFGGERLERAGAPVLLPDGFKPEPSRIYAQLSTALESPPVEADSRCELEARIVSADSNGQTRCEATLSCSSSKEPSVLFEEVVGPCTLSDDGTIQAVDFRNDEGLPDFSAEFPDARMTFRPAPGADVVELERHGAIGIPECDEYIDKYTRCIEENMPKAAGELTLKAVQQSIDAWKQAATGPAAETLALTCKNALSTARRATAAMGCKW